MHTLKRTLSLNAQDAQPPKKRATDTVSCATQGDENLLILDAVLRVNVFPFLSSRDAAVLLSCSKVLWHDTGLAALALKTGPARLFVDHFDKDCGWDWFLLETMRYPSGMIPFDDCEHSESDESDDGDEELDDDEEHEEDGEEDGESGDEVGDVKCVSSEEEERDGEDRDRDTGDNEDDADDDEDAESNSDEEDGDDEDADDDEADRPQANAQLLSLIAAFERFILRATLPEDICITSYADNVFPVPVAVSLWDYHPRKQQLQGGHKWTRTDVRRALNAAYNGLGDLFTDTDADAVHVTEVGAHWESIQLAATSGTAPCVLCDKVAYLQAAFNATKSGDRAALTALQASAAGQTYAHCKRAIARHASPYFDKSDNPFEALLESDKVNILAPPLHHFDFETVATAVDETYSVPDVCRSFVQPLKQFLLQHCQFVRRIEFPTPSRYELRLWHGGSSDTTVELLAGVTPSGYLCGAFFTLVHS